MSILSLLYTKYDTRSIALAANGLFAGVTLTTSLAIVPAIKASTDPLPVFIKSFDNGGKIAVSSMIVASVANLGLFYYTNEKRYLLCGLLSIASAPFTGLFIMPIYSKLLKLADEKPSDRENVKQLVTRLGNRHHVRTILSLAAIAIGLRK